MCSDGKFLRTDIVRKTLTTTMNELLGSCSQGEHVLRVVHVHIPPSPQVFLAVDLSDKDRLSVRTYDFPPVYPGVPITIKLAGTQKLFGMCAEGYATTTLVIEEILLGGDA